MGDGTADRGGVSAGDRRAPRSCRRGAFAAVIATSLVLATLAVVQTESGAPRSAGKDWIFTGGDWNNSRHSTLTQITTQNVKNLGGAWVSQIFDDGASSRATPIVHDGLMFVTAAARAYALNAKTGETVWTWRSNARRAIDVSNAPGFIEVLETGLGIPAPSGVAVGHGLVFVGLMDGQVVALREKTGALVWARQTGDDPPTPGQAVTAGVTYADGVVFVPLGVGEFGMNGRVTALDATSGRQLWQFFVVPRPGEQGHETWAPNNDLWKVGGGGIWQVGTVDPDLGLVFFGTGNPMPAFSGILRPGKNLYTVSVIAIEMKTGKLRWYYQLTHHDIWEGDIATPLMLYDAHVNGRSRKALAAMRADGYLFLLDRETGTPLFPVQERAVPQDAAQKSAATQPFPAGENFLGDYRLWKKKIPAGFVLDKFSPPSSSRPNVLQPSMGVRVQPMSYSPQTRYIYVQGINSLHWIRPINDDPWLTPVMQGQLVPNLARSLRYLGLAPMGVLAAIDTRTNTIAWRKEMAPELLGSGPLTSAGGLLFRGSGDGNFEAYDAKTGDRLWQFQTGFAVGRGPASTYEVDGEQYVAVALGPSVWAFKLGGTVPPRPAPTVTPSDIVGDPIEEATDDIEIATVRTQADKRAGPEGYVRRGQRAAVDEYAFNPERARTAVGHTIRFINNGKVSHTIVANDGSWTTGRVDPGLDKVMAFEKPGTYSYHCLEHPWALGQLTVTPRSLDAEATPQADRRRPVTR